MDKNIFEWNLKFEKLADGIKNWKYDSMNTVYCKGRIHLFGPIYLGEIFYF